MTTPATHDVAEGGVLIVEISPDDFGSPAVSRQGSPALHSGLNRICGLGLGVLSGFSRDTSRPHFDDNRGAIREAAISSPDRTLSYSLPTTWASTWDI